ncbi:MAG TPA: Gfo/Idh/MocA family oxidoreductase [Tepidisphaeraceae bacterium]|nr:Gfo/Idh/MocA family oxidoreductase [Tepidisphaeraceae bacterium]
MKSNGPFSRRGLLRYSAAAAFLSGLPSWYLADLRAAEEAKPTADKPKAKDDFRIGLVGCGGMGTGDAKDAQRFGKVVAVCDVDENQLGRAKKNFPDAKGYKDFRELVQQKDLDVVICATVDHWHTLVSIAAMKAGKDVYTEKPLTLCIDEGKRLVKVQKETGRVLQTGTQQRSDIRFRLAVDLVRNGRIGKLKHIDVWIPAGQRKGPFAKAPVPAGFDWDLWQGPTPAVDYVKERAHQTFRYWWEYSGGTITDWGAHHNDIALWTTGFDRSGPVSVEGKALNEMIPGGFTANSEHEIHFTYPDGVTHTSRSTTANSPFGAVVDPKGRQHGIAYIGTEGWLWVTRGKIDASKPEMLKEKLPESAPRVYVSNDHKGNFFECVKTRKAPICDVEIGHRSATMCHLGVAAVRLGRKLNWDPVKEEYVGDAEAQATAVREMRKPYDYSFIEA